MLLELGGGTNPHPRADVVIDINHSNGVPAQDATITPWLYWGGEFLRPDSIDEVYASHFMEHVPHGRPLIDVMNEAWRVLKPGGTFTMIMPLVGYTQPGDGRPMNAQIGWQPWADPTHVSFWWLPEALLYFCEGDFKPAADYGIRTWGPLGECVSAELASVILYDQQRAPVSASKYINTESFWAVRQGWEGVARLVKP